MEDKIQSHERCRMTVGEPASEYGVDKAALAPFKHDEWIRLTPAERLERSWRLRSRIPDIRAVHDRKLFPKP
ncbi:MAG: hypothetical protein ABIF71_01770 [Planctomycetota bacterium]